MKISPEKRRRIAASYKKIVAKYAKADQLALDMLRHPDTTPEQVESVRAILIRMNSAHRELRADMRRVGAYAQ